MDASSINTVDNIELETLTLAYIQTLKRINNKMGPKKFYPTCIRISRKWYL